MNDMVETRFTEPDWTKSLSGNGPGGGLHCYEDKARGLRMAVWVPKRGKACTVYSFDSDPQEREFATEDAMLDAYEKSPGVLCVTCGAIADRGESPPDYLED